MGLTNEGEQWNLERSLRGQANAADLYVGLYQNATEPAETATLASGLTEVSTSGTAYARVLIECSSVGWPTIGVDSVGRGYVVSKILTFAAPTGSWGTMWGAFLTTVASGTAGLLVATYHWAASVSKTTGDPAIALRLTQPSS